MDPREKSNPRTFDSAKNVSAILRQRSVKWKDELENGTRFQNFPRRRREGNKSIGLFK